MRAPAATFVEALLVGGAGLALGLLANAASPRGLTLDRDYSPRALPRATLATPPGPATPPRGPAEGSAGATEPGAAEPRAVERGAIDPGAAVRREALERLAAKGLRAVLFDEAKALHEDPLHEAGAYLFVDARTAERYEEGHLPGALPFDRFRIERDLQPVLDAAAGTLRIVIYCHGGACEDSEFAALTLAGLLADPSVLSVYVGGIEEWTARGQPVVAGPSPR